MTDHSPAAIGKTMTGKNWAELRSLATDAKSVEAAQNLKPQFLPDSLSKVFAYTSLKVRWLKRLLTRTRNSFWI